MTCLDKFYSVLITADAPFEIQKLRKTLNTGNVISKPSGGSEHFWSFSVVQNILHLPRNLA